MDLSFVSKAWPRRGWCPFILFGYGRISSPKKGGLCAGLGRKEPAACSGWRAGDCRAGAGCRCLCEGPARGSGRCAGLGAAETALSPLPSSALLAYQGQRSVFVVVPVCPCVRSHSLSPVLGTGGKRTTEALLFVLSSTVSLSNPQALLGSHRGRLWCPWCPWGRSPGSWPLRLAGEGGGSKQGRVGRRLWQEEGRCSHWWG